MLRGKFITSSPEDLLARLMKFVRVNEATGCWEWMGYRDKPPQHYGRVNLAGRKRERLHRLMYQLHVGPIPKGKVVCHKCDHPPCCNPAHLFLGTQLDNIADATAKRRVRRGDSHPHAKLTSKQVAVIRQRVAAGEMLVSVAADFGISDSTVANIRDRVTWA